MIQNKIGLIPFSTQLKFNPQSVETVSSMVHLVWELKDFQLLLSTDI